MLAGTTPVLVHNCSEQQVADHLSAAFPDRNIRQNRDVFREDGSQLTDHDVYDDDFICEVACGGGTGKVAQMQNNILPSANGTRVAVFGPKLKGSVVKGIEAQGVPVFRSLDDLSAWVGPKS